MKRRTLLAGAALAAPASLLLGSPAKAATWSIAATEQVSNKVLMWDKDVAFSDANVQWSWTPGAGGWYNLSDVRFRNTASFGEVALVAASGGNVGIVDKTTEQHQELNDLLWTGSPGGNPHAVERIPDIGAIVTASSSDGLLAGGYLCVYGPTAISNPSTLARVQTIAFKGAHGVLWDPSLGHLWAVGDKVLRAYNVTGTYRNTRLVSAGKSVALSGLGHDLQPDYSSPGHLFVTDTYGAYRVDTATLTKTTVSTEGSLKAWSRHSSGEDVSVRADGTGSRTWGSPTVRFSVGADRTRTGAEFYKARIYTTAFE
ncbi:DUF6528 family protein [Phytomonospora endophytica]|uniref:Uncharacterized protein n=1 Tax=Phytomonospora endophytica TaxID=714109 RepID=A0A841G0U5_9ACTN|nr:DUF6528 family protein [Phytomonospora endophytica]MBB6039277.1 hypothetical protein [Phytomonospora endophytica]GIG69780.1 hypothetical protein Pen01_60750 [Phytomonospora endophytica]